MIARYSRPEMARIWGDRNRYLIWLQVETAACAGMAKAGLISQRDWRNLKKSLDKLLNDGGVDP